MTTTRFAVGEADPDPLTAMWEPSKSMDFYCLFIVVWQDLGRRERSYPNDWVSKTNLC